MEQEPGQTTTPARTLRVIRDQVLVRQDKPKNRLGSGILHAAQGSEEHPPVGIVVAVGSGVLDHLGTRMTFEVQVGDRVLFKRKAASAVNPDTREGIVKDWEDLLVLDEEHIIAIVEPDVAVEVIDKVKRG